MTNLPNVFTNLSSENNDLPLPLLVAKRWNFPLAASQTEDGMYYAVQDWIRGLIGAKDVRQLWNDIQRKSTLFQMSDSIRHLPYVASDSKTYQVDFATDKGLYLIAQYLRVTKARPVLDEIKKFLAAAGAFVDEVRRDPSTVLLSGAMTPDQAVDAAIQAYRAQGKDDNWIRARLEGKIKRHQFTAALTAAVATVLTPRHYATATDDIYVGLWERTAAYLKRELDLPKNANLRDHQPTLALDYQRIAEGVSAHRLGQRDELSWEEARSIVQEVAKFIGKQAKETSEMLHMDLATGLPLLTS